MFTRFLFIAVLTVLIPCRGLATMPEDLRITAFERFKADAKKKIEAEVEKEFKARENNLKKLSSPFKVGEIATVSITQGIRVRQVTGKFKGIQGQHALIGDNRYLLTDISPIDRDRLHFGDNPELLKLKLGQLKRQIEKEKALRRKIIREKLYRQAGYTREFFATTCQLAGRFRTFREMGNRQIQLTLVLSEHDPYATATIKAKWAFNFGILVLYDNRPIATNLDISKKPATLPQAPWRTMSFRLNRKDLGKSVGKAIEQNLRLWVMEKDVGSWLFRPVRRARPAIVTQTTTFCPECLGTGKITAPNDKNVQLPCPTCGGTGKVSCDPYNVTKYEEIMLLVKSRISRYSQIRMERFAKYAAMTQKYQKKIDQQLTGLQQKARADRLAKEAAARKEAEERKKKEEARIQAEKRRQRIENSFLWLTPEKAQKLDSGEENQIEKHKSTHEFDNIYFPRTVKIDGKPRRIAKFSEWIKVRWKAPRDVKDFLLSSIKYRFLKINLAAFEDEEPNAVAQIKKEENNENENEISTNEKPDLREQALTDTNAAGRYFLEYRLAYMNNQIRVQKFNAKVQVIFRDKSTSEWTDTFTIPPQWFGSIFGIREMNLEKLEKGVSSLSVKGKIDTPQL